MPRPVSTASTASRLASVSAGANPRSASFAPSSTDHQVGCIGQHPVEPRSPSGRGIAGDAGVDGTHVQSIAPQPRLELGREGIFRRQAEAGGQAVAQDRNHGFAVDCRRNVGHST